MSELQNKYIRTMIPTAVLGQAAVKCDVYDVLRAFDVVDPPIQHAVKKLLCAGIRGSKNQKQDYLEAIQAVERAVENLQASENKNE